ncbi:MAG: hypothetical protein OIN85_01020 [Candidatus Methanoperedens sp.]|nr:hypothetical protein [Candidatus Methanoperedens sp.]
MSETTVSFSKRQIEYLIKKTGADNPQEAIEIFALIIRDERIEPTRMLLYLNKVMEKDGVK